MRSIKLLFFIGGAAILLAGCGSGTKTPNSLDIIAKNREVHVLTEGMNAPFEFGKDTAFQGLAADVGEDIAKTIGYPLKWIGTRGVNHLFEVLKDGTTVDMIISSVINEPHRSADFDFSESYYDTGDVIAHHRTEFGVTDLASLSGKTVGVVTGRPADTFMTSQTTATNVTITRYATVDEALGFLNRREIDAVVGDEILLNYSSVESFPNTNIMNTIINKYSYAVAVRKGDAKLLEKINETISRMKSSGELAKLEEQWIGDVKERAKARASADREEEELKKAPKTITTTISKQGGNWSMERLDGFQFVLQGANGTYRSTPIETDGVSRGSCRFTQPVPPGNYTLNVSILGLTANVKVDELPKSSLSMAVNIASGITITLR
ncbi:MAG: transporter substrate-binding domain-containing protein [Acidobacteriota bacterium]|nr:transporter substrate-binding domain-containing protein [Acidobacteriota bacterium]